MMLVQLEGSPKVLEKDWKNRESEELRPSRPQYC